IHRRHHPPGPDGAHRRPQRRLLDQTAGGRQETEMNRRKFLKTAAVAPASAPGAVPLAAPAANAILATRIVRLNLQHTWTTTMSSSQYRDTLHTTYTRGGI